MLTRFSLRLCLLMFIVLFRVSIEENVADWLLHYCVKCRFLPLPEVILSSSLSNCCLYFPVFLLLVYVETSTPKGATSLVFLCCFASG